MTGERLEPGISTQHQESKIHFVPTGRPRTKEVALEQRVRAWRLGRPTYEEKVTIKVELPAQLNDLLEQFKVLKRIPKNEMITFALEELLRQS